MIVYRICQKYPPDHNPIDGMGAFKNGGRWNLKGTYAVYTASSLALARSELARHVNLESIPDHFRVYEIEIPESEFVALQPLPYDWNEDPPAVYSQEAGTKTLQNLDYTGFKVPSVCDPKAFNYILNPLSRHYSSVKRVRDYPFIA
jgi:RES domain-containing protein